MTAVFNAFPAAVYDTVYAGKNYVAECEAMGRRIARFGRGELRRMLDLGCGIGRHVVIFADRAVATASASFDPSSGRRLPDHQCCELSVNVRRSKGLSPHRRGRGNAPRQEFFRLGLDFLLHVSGFRPTALTGFPDVDASSGSEWATAMVATAV
ncbi:MULTISPECIES: hypothetical protein [unclassified Bradyrhizobium]|uniref:hypothetical protein n=1 Tax=unclassified Bradyrhizobium TaxID=2631580 RepID=UPI001FF7EA0F|nr:MULTISPECIES: hypothetical protein [unclassified Bradyrhizobium]MCK1432218.1 hypothetical protein [Bradyrhizobium sp. 87]MCK1589240.1 hypothetical protein [Bradyrhizobium sp. 169]